LLNCLVEEGARTQGNNALTFVLSRKIIVPDDGDNNKCSQNNNPHSFDELTAKGGNQVVIKRTVKTGEGDPTHKPVKREVYLLQYFFLLEPSEAGKVDQIDKSNKRHEKVGPCGD
jgi:hypothetical protein